MTNITLLPPIVGSKNTTEEPKVGTAIKAIEQYLNQTVVGTGIGTENVIKESITEEKLSAAVQVLLNQKAAGLELKKQAGSTTGASGVIYLMETNATTLTLPAATSSRQVGIICKNTVAAVALKATGVKIFGDFLAAAGVEVINIAENQHVVVEADGTNWWIISGEPKREQLYSARVASVAGEGHTPNTVRPVEVVLTHKVSEGGIGSLVVAGKEIMTAVIGAGAAYVSFICPPGGVWKASEATEYSYLIL